MYSIDIKDKLMIGRRNLHERIFNRKRIHGAGRRQIYVICFRGGLPGLYGGLTEGDRAVCHSGGVPDACCSGAKWIQDRPPDGSGKMKNTGVFLIKGNQLWYGEVILCRLTEKNQELC